MFHKTRGMKRKSYYKASNVKKSKIKEKAY